MVCPDGMHLLELKPFINLMTIALSYLDLYLELAIMIKIEMNSYQILVLSINSLKVIDVKKRKME